MKIEELACKEVAIAIIVAAFWFGIIIGTTNKGENNEINDKRDREEICKDRETR